MSVTTGCHSPAAAAAGVVLSMAPHGGSEMAAPPEDPDERTKRRNYLILIVVWALVGVGFLLSSRFITGLPRWARNSIFALEPAAFLLLMSVLGIRR